MGPGGRNQSPPPPPPPEKPHLLPVQNPPARLHSSSSDSRVAAEPAHPIKSPATVSAPMRPRRLRMIIRPLHRTFDAGRSVFRHRAASPSVWMTRVALVYNGQPTVKDPACSAAR